MRRAALVAVAASLAGCGGDGDGPPSRQEARRHDWHAEREGTLTLLWRAGQEGRAGRRARACVV